MTLEDSYTMITYEIAYTPKNARYDGYRDYINYHNKNQAMKKALKLMNEGCIDIFIDTYEGSKNDTHAALINYLRII